MAQILPILEKKFYTVSEITEEIKNIIEDEFFDVWILGEVSNVVTPMSGHTYFTLKDKTASIKAVLFKTQKKLINYNIKNGEEIVVRGRISLYEPRGEYQIIIDYLEPYGIGKLYMQIEKLKEKLFKEGLFEKKFKKNIPKFPEKIGVVTSVTGAAIRDILNVLNRRFTGIELFIFPVKVQGEEAPNLITEGIKFFNNFRENIDVIILARGGGSIEDLMPFNDETVARAIFKSNIPIISAVGHETDFSISDLVADLRAPTPSAAAELVVKNKQEVSIHLDNLTKRLTLLIKSKIDYYKHIINNSNTNLNNFRWEITHFNNKIKIIKKDLINSFSQYFNSRNEKVKHLTLQLYQFNPKMKIKNYKDKLDYFSNNLYKNYFALFNSKKNSLLNFMQNLHYLSPLNILNRGYAIVQKNKKLIQSINDVKINDRINIKVSDGNILAKVENH
jgi:exodeoxyribonuclease VII large subunit